MTTANLHSPQIIILTVNDQIRLTDPYIVKRKDEKILGGFCYYAANCWLLYHIEGEPTHHPDNPYIMGTSIWRKDHINLSGLLKINILSFKLYTTFRNASDLSTRVGHSSKELDTFRNFQETNNVYNNILLK